MSETEDQEVLCARVYHRNVCRNKILAMMTSTDMGTQKGKSLGSKIPDYGSIGN